MYCKISRHISQAVKLWGFRASVNPTFEARITDFMDGVPYFYFYGKIQYILMWYIER